MTHPAMSNARAINGTRTQPPRVGVLATICIVTTLERRLCEGCVGAWLITP